jgi:hypothetical protein
VTQSSTHSKASEAISIASDSDTSTKEESPYLSSMDAEREEYQPYRQVNKFAVLAAMLGVVSVIGLLAPFLLLVGVVALVCGWLGYRATTIDEDIYTGKPLAIFGGLLGGIVFVTGISFHTFVYLTEVPDGYERISWTMLEPAKSSRMPVPNSAIALDGKRVFIKGYVYPDGQKNNIKQFVLIPDLGTCCFGGQPKLTDMIEVTFANDLSTEYSYRMHKLGGVLRVSSQKKPVDGLDGVYYELEADYLR